RDQIAGQHPGALVITGGQTTGNMWEGHIRDRGIQQLHEGRQSDRDRYQPGIGFPIGAAGCRRDTVAGHIPRPAHRMYCETDWSQNHFREGKSSATKGDRTVSYNQQIMRKGDKTRERIIEQAAPIFNQRGYDGASMAELMAATGLEKGGIYRHFNSKEEIAAEAFDYAWRSTFELRTKDLGRVPNRVDRLQKLLRNIVERTPSIPGGCPLLNTAIDSDDGNPVLRARAKDALETYRGL